MTNDANADSSGSADPVGGSQVRQVIEAATTPAAKGLASLVLALLSLLSLAPATEIGQLDTSSDLGLPLPSSHTLQISIGIRLAVALLALVLAVGGVRTMNGPGSGLSRIDPKNWMTMVCGAAAIVALVAVVLNFAALADALTNQPFYSVYNHIGS